MGRLKVEKIKAIGEKRVHQLNHAREKSAELKNIKICNRRRVKINNYGKDLKELTQTEKKESIEKSADSEEIFLSNKEDLYANEILKSLQRSKTYVDIERVTNTTVVIPEIKLRTCPTHVNFIRAIDEELYENNFEKVNPILEKVNFKKNLSNRSSKMGTLENLTTNSFVDQLSLHLFKNDEERSTTAKFSEKKNKRKIDDMLGLDEDLRSAKHKIILMPEQEVKEVTYHRAESLFETNQVEKDKKKIGMLSGGIEMSDIFS
ncbi:hypothetical protein SNEBB_003683 [Seison nebaliae]|nr:hypothetical protein SNEBB_003683 [Seison nebaliae]